MEEALATVSVVVIVSASFGANNSGTAAEIDIWSDSCLVVAADLARLPDGANESASAIWTLRDLAIASRAVRASEGCLETAAIFDILSAVVSDSVNDLIDAADMI